MIDRAHRRGAARNAAIALLTFTATLPTAAAAAAPRADASHGRDGGRAATAAPPVPAPTPAREVRVIAAGRGEDVAALGSTLRELLGRIGVTVVMESTSAERARAPSARPGDFAAVGVDLTAGGAVVVVTDGAGQEQMRRSLPASGDRAAAIEEAAHVVQAAVEALTEEQQAGDEGEPVTAETTSDAGSPAPAALPPVAPAPVATASLEPRPVDVVDAAAASSPARYGLDVLGALDTTIDGERSGLIVGAEAGAVVRRARGAGSFSPSVWIIGDYHAPFRAIRDDVLVDITMVSARILPTVALARGDSWLVEGGVGAGLDVVIAQPGTTQPVSAQLSPTRTDLDPILTAMVAAHTALTASADLFIAARLDVDLGTERYDVMGNGAPVTVFDPWTFRPELLVGFNLGLLGAPDYPARKALP